MFLKKKGFKMFKKIKIFNLIFVLLLFILSTSKIYSNENKSIIILGENDAKITVKVFSSLTCPHCAHFHNNIFKNLKEDFIDNGTLKFEYHGFPLDLAALNAEKLLNCTKGIEKKIAFLNELYKKQSEWAVGSDINNINSKLEKMARNYGINNDKVLSCLNDENLEEEILNNRINGHKKYEIESTPTILINEKKYNGNHEYKNFKKAINKFL